MNVDPEIFRREPGLTIIELLVVIGIVAVVSALTFPRLAAVASLQRLDGAANGLGLNLQKTRLRAIAEGKCLQVSFDSAAREYQVLSKTGTIPCGDSGFVADGLGQTIDDAAAIALSSTANPIFDAQGRGATPSVITLTAPNGAVRLVAVNAAGQVRVR